MYLMGNRSEFRVIFGLLIWIGLIAVGVLIARQVLNDSPTAVKQLVDFTTSQRYLIPIEFDSPQVVRRGDLVFLAGDPEFNPVGMVSRVGAVDSTETAPVKTKHAWMTFYGGGPTVSEDDILYFHRAEESTEWVIKTMLPPSKRDEIAKLIMAAYSKNQEAVVDAIRPIVEQSLRDAGSIIKADLKAAFAKRSDRLQAIGNRYQDDLIEKELVPLIQDEIWPIVQEESQPLASEIGNEIWREVSLFRFGWRYLIDKSPLPAENLTEAEFERFVEQKAVPILKKHVGEFVELQQSVLARVSKNEKVRTTFSSALKTVINDPDVQDVFTDVFQEVFVNNPRLKQSMEKHWKSPEARAALDLTSQRLEPTINEIGVALFGSPRSEITPEFARVLRHRILHRDGRWFTLEINGDSDPNQRPVKRPEKMHVRIAEPTGNVPYAPARDRP